MTLAAEKTFAVEGIRVPDSSLARKITELVRDTESALLFHHSSRVYYWGALAGKRRSLKFDRELLYAGAMFHDMGLTPAHCSAHERFEVDGANAARDFLRSHGVAVFDRSTNAPGRLVPERARLRDIAIGLCALPARCFVLDPLVARARDKARHHCQTSPAKLPDTV